MTFLDLYYRVKPLIPRRLQIAVRRQVVRRQREKYRDVWPIDSEAGKSPEGWPGWPEGKQFALVLTHDIESAEGLNNLRPLAELEMKLGFRSSFNFVAGDYPVSRELRDFLTTNGFEVGVHGYTHKKGNPYKNDKTFRAQKDGINRSLKEWEAFGHRTPCMYHDLSKISQLDIEYDSSTFDVDPFEPQPDSVNTIFPFWVEGANGNGFVEIPCTLPQDFTLFVIMAENDISIWKRKLDWIVEKGGMALLNVHPDYLAMPAGKRGHFCYPVKYYEEFLNMIAREYQGKYWAALPKEMANFCRGWEINRRKGRANSTPLPKEPIKTRVEKSSNGKTIWIDLDNTPHIPFFNPIIREIEKRGGRILLTARDCAQTCGMADLFSLNYQRIGRHYGKNKILKVAGTIYRSMQLIQAVRKNKIDLAVSHGSRAQALASKILKIPNIVIGDYEHAKLLVKPSWIMVPELISPSGLSVSIDRIIRYPGIKEDVYVPDFQPDQVLRKSLSVGQDEILVTIRPPAVQAHYHNPESETLFTASVERLGLMDQIRMVILPRYEDQEGEIRKTWPDFMRSGKIIIPKKVLNGLNLLWFSDLVISGGGTMNREAAALGVPVYSIFRGKLGDVDRYLAKEGRLVLLESVEDVQNMLKIEKRVIPEAMPPTSRTTLNAVVEGILKALG